MMEGEQEGTPKMARVQLVEDESDRQMTYQPALRTSGHELRGALAWSFQPQNRDAAGKRRSRV